MNEVEAAGAGPRDDYRAVLREEFYEVHRDHIVQVICALIADPDPNKPRYKHDLLVTEAALIVNEVVKRAGDGHQTLPE